MGAALCFSRSIAEVRIRGDMGGARTTRTLMAPSYGGCQGSPAFSPIAME